MKKILLFVLTVCLCLAVGSGAAFSESPEEMSADELFQAGLDAYNEKDYDLALECYQKAADLGHAHAVNNLGLLYTYGYGVEQSWEKAREYYQQAADLGYDLALANLGLIYENGYGTEKSIEKAMDYFQQALDLGAVDAYNCFAWLYYTGDGVEQSYEKAVEYWQLGAEKGNTAAQGFLGSAYLSGQGVEQSNEKALEYLLPAAEKKDANSLNNLGVMYRDGMGVEQDPEKAFDCFQQAAEQNHPLALNNLGSMYRDGLVVEQDLVKAAEYFKKAAELGNGKAAENLKELEEDARTLIYGTNAEINGDFAPGAWWSNGSTDNMLRDITNDYYTVVTDQGGAMVVNQTVCESFDKEVNADGTETFTIKIKEGLLFNNGEPITAKDFVWEKAFGCTQAAAELGIRISSFAIGCSEYTNGEAETIKGLRMSDDRTIQITIPADYVPYYYDALFGNFGAFSMKYWLGDAVDLKDDGEGVYFTGLTKEAVQDQLEFAVSHAGEDRVSAGPYNLVEFDPETRQAVLVRNRYYQGNFEGQKPSVGKIIITKIEKDTWAEELKTGKFNFCETLSGKAGINTAMEIIGDDSVREALGYGYDYVQFDRAGYNQIVFQSDFGPTRFTAVRQAIAYLLDREAYINTISEGWARIVNGPYGSGMWMTQQAEEWLDENLNSYPYDPEKAVELLVEDGWVYDENGNDYAGGIRYKKVTEEEAVFCPHTILLENGTRLMGLELEWCAMEGGPVNELLNEMLVNGTQIAAAGMKINQHAMSFSELLNYYYRNAAQGEEYGIPTYNMISLSLSFPPQYSFARQFSRDAGAYNVDHNYDEELDRLSLEMVYGVESGDDEAFLEVWKAFIKRWNEVLPELPLSSDIYVTVFPDWLEGYKEDSYWDFDKAILYASVRE